MEKREQLGVCDRYPDDGGNIPHEFNKHGCLNWRPIEASAPTADLSAILEEFEALAKQFRETTVNIGNHFSMRPLTDTQKGIARICGDALSALIQSVKERI